MPIILPVSMSTKKFDKWRSPIPRMYWQMHKQACELAKCDLRIKNASGETASCKKARLSIKRTGTILDSWRSKVCLKVSDNGLVSWISLLTENQINARNFSNRYDQTIVCYYKAWRILYLTTFFIRIKSIVVWTKLTLLFEWFAEKYFLNI